jgi:hypothetical protein
LLACWFGAYPVAVAGPPDAPQVTRVVKLTYLAIILPELQLTRESWGSGTLWTPSVQQVAEAEKAIVRDIDDGAEAGKAQPKVEYLIQYWGLSVDSRKWIVCQVWRVDALGKKFDGLNEFLTNVLTESLTVIEEPSPPEPPHYFEYYYDPATGALEDSPFREEDAASEGPACGGRSDPVADAPSPACRAELRRVANQSRTSRPSRGIRGTRTEKRK